MRGYRLLGDDYAPLDPRDGTVHPYPRAIALQPQAAALVPEAFRAALREPAAPRLFDKTLIDAGTVLGDGVLATEPAPVRRVLLLVPPDHSMRRSSPGRGSRSLRRGQTRRPLKRRSARSPA